jgi:hypothetical protein
MQKYLLNLEIFLKRRRISIAELVIYRSFYGKLVMGVIMGIKKYIK